MYYVSSASALGTWPVHHPHEPIPETLTEEHWQYALPMGYGESKHVSERLMQRAAEHGASVNIFRVGQIAGPTEAANSVWTPSEWFPTLMRSSRALKKFPANIGLQQTIDWIPCDVLGQVMVEIVCSAKTNDGPGIYNLVNPQRTSLRVLLETAAAQYDGELVSYDEWLRLLEDLDPTNPEHLAKVPALKLLDFYRGLRQSKESFMATENGQRDSKTMASLGQIDEKQVIAWTRHWQ